MFILLGHHMWFCYKNTLLNFKLKANTYPIKILSPVDDRNIYNNFLRFWNINGLKSLFKQCCSMPELISTSCSVPLGQPPHITTSTLLDIHSALSVPVTSNFIFCIWINESWDACLFHLAYFTWHSDFQFFSFHIMGFHPFCDFVLCSVPLHNILQFSFPFMQCFISWLLWTVM